MMRWPTLASPRRQACESAAAAQGCRRRLRHPRTRADARPNTRTAYNPDLGRLPSLTSLSSRRPRMRILRMRPMALMVVASLALGAAPPAHAKAGNGKPAVDPAAIAALQ